MQARPTIVVSAVLVTDADGRLLLVRKRGTSRWMQAGGKPEPGESARDAAVRELAEEVAIEAAPDDLVALGRFETTAANEAGHRLLADVFALRFTGAVTGRAEIEEAVWLTRAEADALGDALAPLARDLLEPPPTL